MNEVDLRRIDPDIGKQKKGSTSHTRPVMHKQNKCMDIEEKVRLINSLLAGIEKAKASVPQILSNSRIPKKEDEYKYRIIENELIRLELVQVLIAPNTNKTVGGWGLYRISTKGLELLNENKSASVYYPEEYKKKDLLEILQRLSQEDSKKLLLDDLINSFENPLLIEEYVNELSALKLVTIEDQRTKDTPDAYLVKLEKRAKYILEGKSTLDQLLNNLESNTIDRITVFENISNSIVNKGNDLNISNSNIEYQIGKVNVKTVKEKENDNRPTKKNQKIIVIVGIISLIVSIIIAMLRVLKFI